MATAGPKMLNVAAPRGAHTYSIWILLLLLSVWFTPTLRLPGDIPLRFDDLLIFGMGGLLLGRFILTFHYRKPDSIWWIPIVMAASMLLSAVLATMKGDFPIGAKEYLDLIRPISFLIIYVAVRVRDPHAVLSSIRTTFRAGTVVLTIFALIQFLLLTPSSGGILANFFLLYTSLTPEHARSFFGLRPFATFQTPTDLGYIMMVFLLAEAVLYPQRKRIYLLLALIGLVLSNTRTFLFATPILVLLYAMIYAKTTAARVKLIVLGSTCILLGMVFLLYVAPLVNSTFATNTIRTATSLSSGNYSQDESIAIRLQKLALVIYTWQHAPLFGVASRQMLGEAADSEYVYTFHRYGLFGIVELMGLYVAALKVIGILKIHWLPVYTFTVLMLFTTFLYGFTQGALIDVRVGIIPMVLLGYASAIAKDERLKVGT